MNRYPASVRPFGSCPPVEESDAPYGLTLENDHTFTVVIPKGSSRNTTMQEVHWHAAKFDTTSEYASHEEHTTTAKVAANKDKLMDALGEMIKDRQDAEETTSLGLDAPRTKQLDRTWLRDQLEGVYHGVVQKVVKPRADEKSRAEKKKVDK